METGDGYHCSIALLRRDCRPYAHHMSADVLTKHSVTDEVSLDSIIGREAIFSTGSETIRWGHFH